MQINGTNYVRVQQTNSAVDKARATYAQATNTQTATVSSTDSVQLSDHTFSFPPANAPQEMKDAYDKLSPNEKFALSAKAFGMSAQANTHRDANGNVTRFVPGDAGYVDIYNQPGLTVGGFMGQVKDSVLKDQQLVGHNPMNANELDIVNRFMDTLTQSGAMDKSL